MNGVRYEKPSNDLPSFGTGFRNRCSTQIHDMVWLVAERRRFIWTLITVMNIPDQFPFFRQEPLKTVFEVELLKTSSKDEGIY